MHINVNGKTMLVKENLTLKEFLVSANISFEKTVVELNSSILNSLQWDNVTLCENDRLEILSFVGGG